MARVPRAKGPNDQQVTVNLPSAWVDEVDEIASTVAAGVALTRSDALRTVIRTGIDAIKAKRAAADPPPKRRR